MRTRQDNLIRSRGRSLLLPLLLSLASVPPLPGQDVPALLQLIESGRRDSVESLMENLLYEYPGNPGVRYVKAVLESDALVAAGIYKDIVRNHRNTPYEAPALRRLGEYYFAQGLYIQSRQHLMRLVRKYPEDPDLVSAVNLALRAGVAARQLDSVYADLSIAIQNHPNAAFEIPDELDITHLPPGIRPVAPASSLVQEPPRPLRKLGERTMTDGELTGRYVLQAGAFSREGNAENLRQQIEAVGYPAQVKSKVIGGRTLYLVWVGRYDDLDTAKRAIGLLESALGIKPFPVDIQK